MKSRHLQLSLPLLAHQQKKKLAGHSSTLLWQREALEEGIINPTPFSEFPTDNEGTCKKSTLF